MKKALIAKERQLFSKFGIVHYPEVIVRCFDPYSLAPDRDKIYLHLKDATLKLTSEGEVTLLSLKRKINVMLIGVFLFALCYFGMAWMNSLLAFTILFAVYAFSISCLESVAKAVISNIVPTQERGQAIGFYTSVNSLGVLFAGVWTGWLWSIGGPQLVFSITAGVALISFFILRWNASKINRVSA